MNSELLPSGRGYVPDLRRHRRERDRRHGGPRGLREPGRSGYGTEPVTLRRKVQVSSHNHHSSISAASQLSFLMGNRLRRNEGASMFKMVPVLKTIPVGLVIVGLL